MAQEGRARAGERGSGDRPSIAGPAATGKPEDAAKERQEFEEWRAWQEWKRKNQK